MPIVERQNIRINSINDKLNDLSDNIVIILNLSTQFVNKKLYLSNLFIMSVSKNSRCYESYQQFFRNKRKRRRSLNIDKQC